MTMMPMPVAHTPARTFWYVESFCADMFPLILFLPQIPVWRLMKTRLRRYEAARRLVLRSVGGSRWRSGCSGWAVVYRELACCGLNFENWCRRLVIHLWMWGTQEGRSTGMDGKVDRPVELRER